jgi:hypothetical protein
MKTLFNNENERRHAAAGRLFQRVKPGLKSRVLFVRLRWLYAGRDRCTVPDHRLFQRSTYAGCVERFGQVGQDAGAQACRGRHSGDARSQDDSGLRKLCAKNAGEPESALTGHLDIAEDHCGRIGGHGLEASLSGIGFDGLVPDDLNPSSEDLPYGRFIVDEQDMI